MAELKEQTRQTLYSYFETGDRPNQEQFKELIDSFLNKQDDDVYIKDGNVGIGTTNPQASLEVQGSLRLSDVNNAGTLYFPSDGKYPNLYIRTGTSDKPVTHLFISGETGNVGIGTTRPKAKLHVEGNMYLNLGEGLEFASDPSYWSPNADARLIRMIDQNGENGEVDGGLVIEGYTLKDQKRKPFIQIKGAGQGNISFGPNPPKFGKLLISHTSVPLVFEELEDSNGNQPDIDKGRLWRLVLDGGNMRFDMNTGKKDEEFGKNFQTPLYMDKYGNVFVGQGNKSGHLLINNSNYSEPHNNIEKTNRRLRMTYTDIWVEMRNPNNDDKWEHRPLYIQKNGGQLCVGGEWPEFLGITKDRIQRYIKQEKEGETQAVPGDLYIQPRGGNTHVGGNLVVHGGGAEPNHYGYIMLKTKRNKKSAWKILDTLGPSQLLIGGCWDNEVTFFWKNESGTKFMKSLKGVTFNDPNS